MNNELSSFTLMPIIDTEKIIKVYYTEDGEIYYENTLCNDARKRYVGIKYDVKKKIYSFINEGTEAYFKMLDFFARWVNEDDV